MSGTHTFNIDKGATFKTTLVLTEDDLTAVDLTGYTGKMQIRRHYDSVLLLEVTSIVITVNQIDITISSTDTLMFIDSKVLYDLDVTNGIETLRLLRGKIIINENVNT